MNTPAASPPSATAFGAFLVGLTARVVAVSASVLPAGSSLLIPDLTPIRRSQTDRSAISAWAREFRTRVSATLRALGIEPDFTVFFDPLPAPSSGLDLAVLAACLGAVGRLGADVLGSTLFLGALSLDGRVRPVRGVLPMLRTAILDREPVVAHPNANYEWRTVVSKFNASEAGCAGLQIFSVDRIADLFDNVDHPGGPLAEPPLRPWAPLYRDDEAVGAGLSARTLRALEVAAAGGHGVLLVGPERLRMVAARALHALLPVMSEQEAIEATEIHSVAGATRIEEQGGLLRERPFRAPHHTAGSTNDLSRRAVGQALVGGGDPIYPGEVSLAHEGTLFLDAAPEIHPLALSALRSVLVQSVAIFQRKDEVYSYPARPAMLVLGAAPCKCEEARKMASGRWDEAASHARWCSSDDVAAYHARALKHLAPFVDMRIVIEADEDSPGVRVSDARERIKVAENVSGGRAIGERNDGKHCHEPRTRIDRVADLEGEPAVFGRHRDEAATLVLPEVAS